MEEIKILKKQSDELSRLKTDATKMSKVLKSKEKEINSLETKSKTESVLVYSNLVHVKLQHPESAITSLTMISTETSKPDATAHSSVNFACHLLPQLQMCPAPILPSVQCDSPANLLQTSAVSCTMLGLCTTST